MFHLVTEGRENCRNHQPFGVHLSPGVPAAPWRYSSSSLGFSSMGDERVQSNRNTQHIPAQSPLLVKSHMMPVQSQLVFSSFSCSNCLFEGSTPLYDFSKYQVPFFRHRFAKKNTNHPYYWSVKRNFKILNVQVGLFYYKVGPTRWLSWCIILLARA